MTKPLGHRNYGSIPHLPGSRVGPGDHTCHEGQARIATVKTRDKFDEIIVQEKLDGTNVGVALLNGKLLALQRRGYLASSSPHKMHHCFARWVEENAEKRFYAVLQEGERIVGEWLVQAHGTIYELQHEPFVAFDVMRKDKRLPYDDFLARVALGGFVTPALLHRGRACSIERALALLGEHGHHGAVDKAEGCVWRVERVHPRHGKRIVDFLVKYVRTDKVDGKYLEENIYLAIPPCCSDILVAT